MCGIGGYYNVSGGEIPLDAIRSLWSSMTVRGTDAAGFCVGWKDTDLPVSYKRPVKSTKLLHKINKYCSGENTQYVLLHTRLTTQGSTENNGNNHPIVGHDITLTHNGVLHNDLEVFQTLNVEPLFEVDTEAINVGLSRCGAGWVLDNIRGSMSIAWVDHKEDTDTVRLMTNGQNPLVIGRTTSGDIVWASTEEILNKSLFKDQIASFFHAIPFKVYKITSDGAITSEYVSEQRDEPHWGYFRYSKRPSYASRKSSGVCVPSKPSRVPTKPSKGKNWVYSEKRGWVRE
tara:strand:- start:160 stop:1023 length:864 start_codon:yes stop_codon:yes gene_type:complete